MLMVNSVNDLRKMTFAALKDFAVSRGFPVCSDYRKADLVEDIAGRLGINATMSERLAEAKHRQARRRGK